MHWTLPLAAVAEISGFNGSDIKSENHFQHTTDTITSIWPWRQYKSSPHTPPHLDITRYGGKLSEGYIFFSPSDQKNERGTYELSGTGFVMTHEGDLVFAAEETGYGFCDEWVAGMTDFRPQTYNGEQHITYWNGCNTKGAHWGHRWGRVTFIDEEYSNFTFNPDLNINTLDHANKGQIDMHDHQMTDRNTMVVTTYNNTRHDLTVVGGEKDGWVADSMFFEVDIATGEVLFQWAALDHTYLEDSRWHLGKLKGTEKLPWDWFHINAVQVIGDNYLISARHHWSLYLINGTDGSVIWRLDGQTGGTFGSIPSRFRWQHHARAHNLTEHGMTVSMFNNHVNGPRNKNTASQGLAFWIPMPADYDSAPSLVKLLETPDDLVFGATQGSYQMDLGNGNGFVGYGKAPVMREFGPESDGTDLRWQGRFGHDNAAMSYRAFKAEWRGIPKHWDPVLVLEEIQLQRSRTPRAYVSWNGATEISGWAVFGGSDRDNLTSLGIAKYQGFETVFDLDVSNCVQVGAIRDGKIIRGSNIACIGKNATNEDIESDVSEAMNEAFHSELPAPEPTPTPAQTPTPIPTPIPAVDQSDIGGLQAEKAELEAEIKDLRKEQQELEEDTWASYRLFGEVAAAVILIVAGTWGYVVWRDWRRRRQYQGVLGSDPYTEPSSFGSRLNVLNFGRNHEIRQDRRADAAAEYDETKLDERHARSRKEMDVDAFGLAEEDDSGDESGSGRSNLSARTPFVRSASTGV